MRVSCTTMTLSEHLKAETDRQQMILISTYTDFVEALQKYLPREIQDWNSLYREFLDACDMDLVETPSRTKTYLVEAPAAVPGQLNGWDRCWVNHHHHLLNDEQLFYWANMASIRNMEDGKLIVVACNTAHARMRAFMRAGRWIQNEKPDWFDTKKAHPDFVVWMNAFVRDLMKNPEPMGWGDQQVLIIPGA